MKWPRGLVLSSVTNLVHLRGEFQGVDPKAFMEVPGKRFTLKPGSIKEPDTYTWGRILLGQFWSLNKTSNTL